MTRIHLRRTLTVAVGVAAATALVACGSNDNSTTDVTAVSTPAPATGSSGDVALADSDLGQILVDSNGMTIYLFEKDTSGDASTCSGACAEAWPPVTVKGDATAGDGVDAAKLTTFKRDDGTTQVAYNGHPLYLYAGDSAPGDTSGNQLDQFGAEWYAMDAAGEAVESGDSSSSDDSTSDNPGGDYSY